MELRDRARGATQTVYEILQVAPTEDQDKRVADAVERALIEIVLEERERVAKVARVLCSPDRDMAHKITDEVRRDNAVLIANLSALR